MSGFLDLTNIRRVRSIHYTHNSETNVFGYTLPYLKGLTHDEHICQGVKHKISLGFKQTNDALV